MPTIKKRFLKPKGRLTDDQRMHLLNGWCLDPGFPFRDEDHRKELWFEYRDELMRNYNISYKSRESFSDIGREQLRPWAWWQYEAGMMPLYGSRGYYQNEMALLTKLNKVTERDRELFREIEEAEKESQQPLRKSNHGMSPVLS